MNMIMKKRKRSWRLQSVLWSCVLFFKTGFTFAFALRLYWIWSQICQVLHDGTGTVILVASIDLYTFVPVLLTLIKFQGVRGIRKMEVELEVAFHCFCASSYSLSLDSVWLLVLLHVWWIVTYSDTQNAFMYC